VWRARSLADNEHTACSMRVWSSNPKLQIPIPIPSSNWRFQAKKLGEEVHLGSQFQFGSQLQRDSQLPAQQLLAAK